MRIDIIPSALLTEQQFSQMCSVYCPHHNVSEAELRIRAVQNIDQVALFTAEDGTLHGFMGFRFRELRTQKGKKAAAFYMGMAYILPQSRGKNLVQKTVVRFVVKFKLKNPFTRLLFWTDAISYKPYMIFARNLRTYFPTKNCKTPQFYREIRDQLGATYYGDQYDAASGTVIKENNRLKKGVAEISDKELSDPDILFYATQNPGHSQGNGLIVMCPASLENILSYFVRQIKPKARHKAPAKETALSPKYS